MHYTIVTTALIKYLFIKNKIKNECNKKKVRTLLYFSLYKNTLEDISKYMIFFVLFCLGLRK